MSKKLTSNRTWALGPGTDCVDHFLSLMPYHCARSHFLKESDFKTVSPRAKGPGPVRGKFFADFFYSNTNLADLTE